MVTVVIPTHNRADIVGKRSNRLCGNGTFSVGDGSSDGSQAVPVKYATPTAAYHAQSTEQHKTRHDGARLVQTPWIAFCGDSDLLAPAKPQRQLDAGKSHRAEWWTFSATSLYERLTPIGGQAFAIRILIGCTSDCLGPRMLRGRWNG
jgi:hypothetical protein